MAGFRGAGRPCDVLPSRECCCTRCHGRWCDPPHRSVRTFHRRNRITASIHRMPERSPSTGVESTGRRGPAKTDPPVSCGSQNKEGTRSADLSTGSNRLRFFKSSRNINPRSANGPVATTRRPCPGYETLHTQRRGSPFPSSAFAPDDRKHRGHGTQGNRLAGRDGPAEEGTHGIHPLVFVP